MQFNVRFLFSALLILSNKKNATNDKNRRKRSSNTMQGLRRECTRKYSAKKEKLILVCGKFYSESMLISERLF